MRALGFLVLLGLASCSQVFGLDPPGLHDAGDPTVTGRVWMRYAYNDGNHEPEVADHDFPELDGEAVLADGTIVPIVWGAGGRFTFARADPAQRYRLRVTTAPGVVGYYEHDAANLELAEFRLGRPDAVTALPGTMLRYDITDANSPSSYPLVFTTGQWMYATAPAMTGGSFFLDWTQVSTPSFAPTLLDATRFDRIHFHLMTNAGNRATLSRYRADDIKMMNADTTTITGTSQALVADNCVRIAAQLPTEASRLAAAGYPATAAAYYVQVYPTLAMGSANVPTLVVAGLDPDADLDEQVMFPNPYAGELAVSVLLARSTTFRLGANTPLQVLEGTSHLTAARGSCIAATDVDLDIAIPVDPVLGETPLAGEAVPVTVDRPGDLELSWRVASGDADRTVVSLHELVSVNGQTSLGKTTHFVTTATSIRVPADLLVLGKTYIFKLSPQSGFAAAGAGDYSEITPPHGHGIFWTGTFVPQN